MLDESKLSYDATTGALTYASGLSGKTLFPKASGQALSKVARSRSWRGHEVARALVSFDDQAAATYNADALAYLELGAIGPDGEATSSARFVPREDFGIE